VVVKEGVVSPAVSVCSGHSDDLSIYYRIGISRGLELLESRTLGNYIPSILEGSMWNR
jgi:hypothetical protein